MKKYISGLTFHGGSPTWKFAAKRLNKQSENFNLFSEFSVYNPKLLELNFKVKHQDFMRKYPRGFGYWIWKPQILLQQYLEYPSADFYYYQDAGGELYFSDRSRITFEDYVSQAKQNGVFAFQSEHSTLSYTKASLLEKYTINKLDPLSRQCMAGSIIVSKNYLLEFVKEWADLMSNYENLIDPLNVEQEGSEFIAHRHDQSCLDLLLKLRGIPLRNDTSSDSIVEMMSNHIPIWNVRNNSRISMSSPRKVPLSDRVQMRIYKYFPSAFRSNSISV